MGEGVQLSSGRRSIPYWQARKRKREEWVLVPIGEEGVVMDQLVVMILVVEPSLAAAVAAHSSDLLSFLVVPFCYLLPDPNHRAAAAGIGIGGVGCLLV